MRDKDPIDPIPSIVARRDDVPGRARSPAKKGRADKTPPPPRSAAGGAGLWARLFIVTSLVVAAVACAWAWQLQQELRQAQGVLGRYEARISDLEDRLSDTDEGMNQSSTAMAVKIKELYSEVDKLWASAWRRNKAQIEALQKSDKAQSGQLASLSKTDKDYSAQLKSLGVDIGKLRKVSGELEGLLANSRANQASLERLGDDVSRMTLDFARLQKRVGTNEEWVESINGFRRQVNRSISELQGRINQLQGAASPPPPGV